MLLGVTGGGSYGQGFGRGAKMFRCSPDVVDSELKLRSLETSSLTMCQKILNLPQKVLLENNEVAP